MGDLTFKTGYVYFAKTDKNDVIWGWGKSSDEASSLADERRASAGKNDYLRDGMLATRRITPKQYELVTGGNHDWNAVKSHDEIEVIRAKLVIEGIPSHINHNGNLTISLCRLPGYITDSDVRDILVRVGLYKKR